MSMPDLQRSIALRNCLVTLESKEGVHYRYIDSAIKKQCSASACIHIALAQNLFNRVARHTVGMDARGPGLTK